MLGTYKRQLQFYLNGEENGQLHTKVFETDDEMEEFIEGTGCEVFDEDVVWEEFDPEMRVYVNVYSVTREYGGPEEGGWYYNLYSCIDCVPVKNKRADEMRELLQEEYKDRAYGNIYSVLGGREIAVIIERERCESETKERPYYE